MIIDNSYSTGEIYLYILKHLTELSQLHKELNLKQLIQQASKTQCSEPILCPLTCPNCLIRMADTVLVKTIRKTTGTLCMCTSLIKFSGNIKQLEKVKCETKQRASSDGLVITQRGFKKNATFVNQGQTPLDRTDGFCHKRPT